jgi:hypothetical protein
MDCAVDTMRRDEYYMLKDAVWRTINPLKIGMLCLQCAEDRLGRPLHRSDFSSASVNPMFAERCAALAERLRRKRPVSSRAGAAETQLADLKIIQARLAKKARTQSPLGRFSAALLPYRSRSGRVPPGTLRRVLSELMSLSTLQEASARARPTPMKVVSVPRRLTLKGKRGFGRRR